MSDQHDPPDSINDRARDVVDLLLIRDLAAVTGSPSLAEIREAGEAVFRARASEASTLGQHVRPWPPTVAAHGHWGPDYARAAASGGIDLTLADAVAAVNEWITQIAAS